MHSLRWAYGPDNQMKMPNFEHVLAEKKSIDVESFMGYFYLWKYASTKLPLPIPHQAQIHPSRSKFLSKKLRNYNIPTQTHEIIWTQTQVTFVCTVAKTPVHNTLTFLIRHNPKCPFKCPLATCSGHKNSSIRRHGSSYVLT